MVQDKNGRVEKLRMASARRRVNMQMLSIASEWSYIDLPSMCMSRNCWNFPAIHNPTFSTINKKKKRRTWKPGREKCSSGERTLMCSLAKKGVENKNVHNSSTNTSVKRTCNFASRIFSYVFLLLSRASEWVKESLCFISTEDCRKSSRQEERNYTLIKSGTKKLRLSFVLKREKICVCVHKESEKKFILWWAMYFQSRQTQNFRQFPVDGVSEQLFFGSLECFGSVCVAHNRMSYFHLFYSCLIQKFKKTHCIRNLTNAI